MLYRTGRAKSPGVNSAGAVGGVIHAVNSKVTRDEKAKPPIGWPTGGFEKRWQATRMLGACIGESGARLAKPVTKIRAGISGRGAHGYAGHDGSVSNNTKGLGHASVS